MTDGIFEEANCLVANTLVEIDQADHAGSRGSAPRRNLSGISRTGFCSKHHRRESDLRGVPASLSSVGSSKVARSPARSRVPITPTSAAHFSAPPESCLLPRPLSSPQTKEIVFARVRRGSISPRTAGPGDRLRTAKPQEGYLRGGPLTCRFNSVASWPDTGCEVHALLCPIKAASSA